MRIKNFFKLNAIALVLFSWLVGCNNNQSTTGEQQLTKGHEQKKEPKINSGSEAAKILNMDSDFEIAKDTKTLHTDRIAAALRLNDEQRLDLQKLLLARLPNNFNKEALDDTAVLAEIGDGDAATSIKHLGDEEEKKGIDIPGKLNATRNFTIVKIRERQTKK